MPSDQANIDAGLIHEDNMDDHMNDDDNVDVAAVQNHRKTTLSSDDPGVKHVIPYSEVYGIHPRRIVPTHKGWKLVSNDADPFTGNSANINHKRRSNFNSGPRMKAITAERHRTINAVYRN